MDEPLIDYLMLLATWHTTITDSAVGVERIFLGGQDMLHHAAGTKVAGCWQTAGMGGDARLAWRAMDLPRASGAAVIARPLMALFPMTKGWNDSREGAGAGNERRTAEATGHEMFI